MATQEHIVAAIGQLEEGNEAHWTKGGKPEVAALQEILGEDISAKERDAAWRAFQEGAVAVREQVAEPVRSAVPGATNRRLRHRMYKGTPVITYE